MSKIYEWVHVHKEQIWNEHNCGRKAQGCAKLSLCRAATCGSMRLLQMREDQHVLQEIGARTWQMKGFGCNPSTQGSISQ
eukprot:1156076-Pelagomonas_calceolata.AAC.2